VLFGTSRLVPRAATSHRCHRGYRSSNHCFGDKRRQKCCHSVTRLSRTEPTTAEHRSRSVANTVKTREFHRISTLETGSWVGSSTMYTMVPIGIELATCRSSMDSTPRISEVSRSGLSVNIMRQAPWHTGDMTCNSKSFFRSRFLGPAQMYVSVRWPRKCTSVITTVPVTVFFG